MPPFQDKGGAREADAAKTPNNLVDNENRRQDRFGCKIRGCRTVPGAVDGEGTPSRLSVLRRRLYRGPFGVLPHRAPRPTLRPDPPRLSRIWLPWSHEAGQPMANSLLPVPFFGSPDCRHGIADAACGARYASWPMLVRGCRPFRNSDPFQLFAFPPRRRVILFLMSMNLVLSLTALASMVPASLVRFRAGEGRDGLFWILLGLAVLGPTAWTAAQFHGAWRTGFAVDLWVSIAATMALFFVIAASTRQGWRLTLLLVPWLLLLGLLATFCQSRSEQPLPGGVPVGWVDAHILFAVATYAMLTIAAVSGWAVLLQEQALKRKRSTLLTRRLPPLADAERLEVRLLATSEAVLLGGLLSGMAAQHFIDGRLMLFDHKTVFSLASFILIGGLLIAHRQAGIRGRRAARFVLLAYLLLTLGFLGVKFVKDVLMS
jgi:ABC-type uncharacterized transport system permease subunit